MLPLSSADRLRAARSALAAAENGVGLRDNLDEAEGGVFHGPAGGGPFLRAAIAVVPSGGWVAFVNVRNVGWLAGAEAGLDLSHVLHIPQVGPHGAQVLALLIEGVDVLCVGGVFLERSHMRRLAARARAERTTILSVQPWPGISRPWEERTLVRGRPAHLQGRSSRPWEERSHPWEEGRGAVRAVVS
ncbi:MAG: hypothetical protein Q4C87_07500 [Actinomycetaceae bacterium]|nr:hypothetical protein [Actinomycetaceae bacterium]